MVRTMLPPLEAGRGLGGGLVSRTEVQLGRSHRRRRGEGDGGDEQAAENGRGKDGVEGPHLLPREVSPDQAQGSYRLGPHSNLNVDLEAF